MGRVDNLQEELLKTKKSHTFAVREISILRTKIKILEKEVKKKDQQIDELLKNDQFATKSEQKLQINSLKRKVVQLERSVREKNEEVAKLLSDRNVAKAAETRQQLEQLNIECARLRKHLSQSVPESEFIREKHQYMDIIGQLTDENMIMRQMIGEMKIDQQEQKAIAIEHELNEEAVMLEMKHLSMVKKKDAEYYKQALNSLIHQRNSTRNSHNGLDQKPPHKQSSSFNRSKSVNTNPENYARNSKVPLNRKFPIRSQPILSKSAALRSKSIEESSVAEKRRVSRQFSDANHICVSRAESDIDKQGHEILMPVKRNIKSMYRNVIESEESSSSNSDEQVNNEQNNYTDETMDSKDEELPTELYDAKGNVYYIHPDKPNLGEEEFQTSDADILFDPNEISEEMKKQSTDSWLESASMLSGQVNLNEENIIMKTLYSHLLRLQMIQVRRESS